MQVIVNSEPTDVAEGSCLADLIEQVGLGGSPVAAEVNKALVPKRSHGECELAEGDRIELVTLVGGG